MTNAVILLDQLQEAGVKVSIDGSDLLLVPADRVPAEMVPELRRHKTEIIDHLSPKDYQQRFAGPGPGEDELAIIERQVRTTGVCLTYCEELADYVAFTADTFDHSRVPVGFTPYTESELNHIAGLSARALQLFHHAKKIGMRITGSRPDEEEQHT